MVPLPKPTTSTIFPAKILNCNSNFVSIKHKLIAFLNLSSSAKHIAQIHAQILASGLLGDAFLARELVRLCSLPPSTKCLSHARLLVEHAEISAPSSWNILIRGFASSDSSRDALRVYLGMRRGGISPNEHTFPFVLKSCAALAVLRQGRQVHGEVCKFGVESNVYVQNALISFYGSCKKISNACKVFDGMSMRTVVSWNAILTACIENSRLADGIRYFVEMRNCGFEPDETTMVVVLSACVELGNLSLGKWVHSQVIERGMVLNCQLGTALVDMYAKCGTVWCASFVFDRMGERNVWTWSAMILGLAQHGFANEALRLFSNMMESTSVRPNYVTFLGVLCACSHAGLVDEGYKYFREMQYVHGIKPMMVHYGAMADILGRAGRLGEAYSFITRMPIEADSVVWRTLLSASSIHDAEDKSGLGSEVQKRLLELEPRRGGNFIMVANMYAEAGMWEKAAKTRRDMKNKGVKKIAGESCVELGGSVYKFYSGNDSRDGYEDTFHMLDDLSLHMKMVNEW
ncbi:pentatricopeptide repeat-containing protein At2g36730-like [Syzygium oleosum]|uniref:pentatricopeptide repeat-containing protein At2g36730-like n=1 Tax=Syzygium oleosum TaxID=219896 RepID=UPI0011D1A9BD|nr:pentatricopeptide repeat-containing protein At2g36730-like [Syzygium oleosum]